MLVLALGELLFTLTHGQVIYLVSTVTLFTYLAVNHGIGKAADVSRGCEHGLMGEDRSIHADDVITLLDVFTPPVILKVALKFGS